MHITASFNGKNYHVTKCPTRADAEHGAQQCRAELPKATFTLFRFLPDVELASFDDLLRDYREAGLKRAA